MRRPTLLDIVVGGVEQRPVTVSRLLPHANGRYMAATAAGVGKTMQQKGCG